MDLIYLSDLLICLKFEKVVRLIMFSWFCFSVDVNGHVSLHRPIRKRFSQPLPISLKTQSLTRFSPVSHTVSGFLTFSGGIEM